MPQAPGGPTDMRDMMGQQGMASTPSWLITTAICIALSALVFALLKLTSKCLLPIAAVLLTGSIIAVLTLVMMSVTQVYTMIGTNATSPVEVFRSTCSTMPLAGGELILVITSVCAFCIGIGCILCIFSGVRRGHIWSDSTGGLGGVGAMAAFCVVGVPFAMIGIAVASAVVVIRCAPPPENSTMFDNQTWVPIPEWARPYPLSRHTPPWSHSRFTSWDHEDSDGAPAQRSRVARVREPMNRGPPPFPMTRDPQPPPPPPPPQPPPLAPPRRNRRTTTVEPSMQPPGPPFESFHHLVHHDENEHDQHEQQHSQSRMASTRSETKAKFAPRIEMIRLRAIRPPPDQAAFPDTAAPPPVITKRVFIGNATMSKVIKIKARNGTLIAIV